MRKKAPECQYCHSKMNRISCLTTNQGKKRWVPVGWSCSVCKWPEIDNRQFTGMGQGVPGSPMCPECERPMKALYSKVKGKNQFAREKGRYVCLNQSHEVKTVPKQLSNDEKMLIQTFLEVITKDGKEVSYRVFEEKHGKDFVDGLRKLDNERTIHDKMMFSWNKSGETGHRVKLIYSDGKIGDFVFSTEQLHHSRKLRKDPPWDIIEYQLSEFGIKMDGYDKTINPEPYINTGLMLYWVHHYISEITDVIGDYLRRPLTVDYFFSNAYVLYGIIYAYDYFKDARNDDTVPKKRETLWRLFMRLLTHGFDVRSLDPESYWLDFWAKKESYFNNI